MKSFFLSIFILISVLQLILVVAQKSNSKSESQRMGIKIEKISKKEIRATNSNTGKIVWKYKSISNIYTFVKDGNLVYISEGKFLDKDPWNLSRLSPVDGKKLFTQEIYSSSTISFKSKTLFASNCVELTCFTRGFNKFNGSFLFSYEGSRQYINDRFVFITPSGLEYYTSFAQNPQVLFLNSLTGKNKVLKFSILARKNCGPAELPTYPNEEIVIKYRKVIFTREDRCGVFSSTFDWQPI
jgi:outer membrane protein assembly factor BamB